MVGGRHHLSMTERCDAPVRGIAYASHYCRILDCFDGTPLAFTAHDPDDQG